MREHVLLMIGSATLRNRVIRILEPSRVYRLADSILRHSWAELSREKTRDTLDDSDSSMPTSELAKETQS